MQNIDQICFSKTGLIYDEFSSLYVALFKNADYHIAIIRALASKWQGMTRTEIFISFMSTFGLKQNMHSLGLVTDSFDMDILFEV